MSELVRVSIPKVYARISRQWVVGDGGMRGVRQVKNGVVRWVGHCYTHPNLISFEGEWVFIEDFAVPELTISQCRWTPHYHTRCGHPYPNGIICEVKEVKNG